MITETHIATTLNALPAERIFFDQHIKEILADVQILARILKYTVSELQDLSINEIIFLLDPTQIKVGKVPIDPGLTNYGKSKVPIQKTIFPAKV